MTYAYVGTACFIAGVLLHAGISNEARRVGNYILAAVKRGETIATTDAKAIYNAIKSKL